MIDRVAPIVTGAVSVLMGGTTLVLAEIGQIDPATAVGSLAVYGPLGVVSMFLLWRLREKDKETAAERAKTDEAREREREADRRVLEGLKEATDEGNKTLASILEHMRTRP